MNDIRNALTHEGCNVLYKGRVIEVCASEVEAIARRDELINDYL